MSTGATCWKCGGPKEASRPNSRLCRACDKVPKAVRRSVRQPPTQAEQIDTMIHFIEELKPGAVVPLGSRCLGNRDPALLSSVLDWCVDEEIITVTHDMRWVRNGFYSGH